MEILIYLRFTIISMANSKDILQSLKPSKFEEFIINKRIGTFLKKLNKKLKDSEAILGGSVAKNTWLRGNHDVDIFVLFNNDKNASDILEETLKLVFKNVERIHGSRDYFQLIYKNLNFEVVPVQKIENIKEAKNVTDISPLHVKWVGSKATKKIADEIRLTKAFAQAQGVYGSETYVKGFSGYVLEIITIYYGSFEKLVKAATSWKTHEIIDISKHHESLNKSKISPLIVVDPIDKTRNAAAALSEDKFRRFINSCKGYLRNEDVNFFKKKELTLKDLDDKDVVIKVSPLKGKKDVVGTKILKCLEYIQKELIEEGYTILEADWYWNEDALLWFKVTSIELPKFKKHYGPPASKEEHMKQFKLKWRHEKAYEENGKIYVTIPRKNIFLKDFISDLVKDEELKNFVESVKILK